MHSIREHTGFAFPSHATQAFIPSQGQARWVLSPAQSLCFPRFYNQDQPRKSVTPSPRWESRDAQTGVTCTRPPGEPVAERDPGSALSPASTSARGTSQRPALRRGELAGPAAPAPRAPPRARHAPPAPCSPPSHAARAARTPTRTPTQRRHFYILPPSGVPTFRAGLGASRRSRG